MTILCPKCHLIRPHDSEAPIGQCPGCGVIYAKVGAVGASRSGGSVGRATPVWRGRDERPSWGKWLLLALIVGAMVAGVQLGQERGGSMLGALGGLFDSTPSPEQLRALAAATPADDILMYTADWCPHCRATRDWLDAYGFRYQTCDIDTGAGCRRALERIRAGAGVPWLVVRGRPLKAAGFDRDAFVTALARKR